jgi:hypothetical protein
MRYIIYCDESSLGGVFYSNFYGGALVRAHEREGIEAALNAIKAVRNLQGEAKWTKISEYNEAAYIDLVDCFFDMVKANLIKVRIMFTQNINQTKGVADYDAEDQYFKLYYQFLKHAFGLQYCNPDCADDIHISVYLDDAPDNREKLQRFKYFLSMLSLSKDFRASRVKLLESEITEIDSKSHTILQAVDIVLGAMQFRLNDQHKAKPEGQRLRGKRTRAKERVYKHINARIRGIYPGFNIGTSTARLDFSHSWEHPYRHWCFTPRQSVRDLARGKRANK